MLRTCDDDVLLITLTRESNVCRRERKNLKTKLKACCRLKCSDIILRTCIELKAEKPQIWGVSMTTQCTQCNVNKINASLIDKSSQVSCQVYCVYTLNFCQKTHQLVCRYNTFVNSFSLYIESCFNSSCR